jgi:HEPN domain-containing protein
MKQTAVEWLEEQLHSGKELSTVIRHAKAMEKVQIINAYWDAYNEGKYSTDKTADEYYKKTFKQE